MARDLRHDRTSRDSTEDDRGEDETSTLLERREYLKLGATAAAAVTGSTAITSISSAASERRGISFDRVVDAVDDLGMDDSGSEPVDDALRGALEEGVLVTFPAGEFRVTEAFHVGDLSRIGISGAGQDSTVFVFDSGYQEKFFRCEGGRDVLLEGFSLDTTASRDTAATITVRVDDGLEIHDIRWRGFTPNAAPSVANLVPYVETVEGVGHVSGITMTDGGVEGTYPDRTSGIFCGSAVEGELIMRDLHIEEMGSTALSARDPVGVVKVEDSFFANNDNSSIRLGGGNHPSKEAWAKNCTVVADASRVENLPDGEAYENCDLVRIDGGHTPEYGALIENCTLEYRSHPPDAFSRGAIARPSFGDNGAFTVRGCTIRLEADGVPAIKASDATSDIPADVTVVDTHITGTATETNADAAIYIEDSDGTTIDSACINLPDLGTGVLIENSDGCEITSSDILTAGEATQFVNSDVSTSNITHDGACRLPSDDGSESSDSTDDTSTDSTDSSSSDDTTDDGSSTTDTSDLSNTLTITGTGTTTNYRFTVSGDLAADPDASDLESWDTISDSTADGWVTSEGQTDTFRFSGSVSSFEFVEGEATVTLNGEQVDPSTLGGSDDTTSDDTTSDDTTNDDTTSDDTTSDDTTSDDSTSSESESQTLRITGTGTTTNYRFTVSGDLAADPDASDLESWDTISDSTADGWVTSEGQTDTFQFTGDVVSFEFVEGEATVELAGEVVDPAALGYDRTLTIVGYDADTTATYEATVSGTIRTNPDTGALSDSDTTYGSTVEDTISNDTHSYRFSGDVTYFDLEGAAGVYLDGEQVDPAALESGEVSTFENKITVDGSTADDGTSYEFSVSGTVSRSPDLASAETTDAISGGTVVGAVEDDADAYRFTGDLVSLNVDGSASVSFGRIPDEN